MVNIPKNVNNLEELFNDPLYQTPSIGGTGPTSLRGAGNVTDAYGTHPRTTEAAGQSISTVTAKPTDAPDSLVGQRVGDYVFENKNGRVAPRLVENSMTDLIQKWGVVSGGSENPIGPTSASVLQSAGMNAALGTTIGRQTANILAHAIAKGATASMASGPFAIAGGLIGAGFGIQAVEDAMEEANEKWLKEQRKIEFPISFYKDKDGKTRYKIDYSKVASGNSLSGESAKKAQEGAGDVAVMMGDDNRLKVLVSPLFANTDRYKELVKSISNDYAGLTKDSSNLESSLSDIKKMLSGEANQYRYEMYEYANYKNTVPGASDEAIEKGYTTQLGGYLGEDDAEKFEVTVIEEGKEVKKTAAAVLDKVLNMSTDDRSDYMLDLEKKISDEDTPDDQKAIYLGEYSMLKAANNATGTEKDKDGNKGDSRWVGMLKRDWAIDILDSVNVFGFSTRQLAYTLSFGNLAKDAQYGLEGNEMIANFGAAISLPMNIITSAKMMEGIESIARKLPIPVIRSMSNIAPQGAQLASVRQGLISAGFNVSADALYDVAKAGIDVMTEEATDFGQDFAENFAQDLILDTIVTFGSYGRASSTWYGNESEISKALAKGMLKITDTKFGDWVGRKFFNDRLDLMKIGYEKLAQTGDTAEYRRFVVDTDINARTARVANEILDGTAKGSADVSAKYQTVRTEYNELFPTGKVSNADRRYMVAKSERIEYNDWLSKQKMSASEKAMWENKLSEKYDGAIKAMDPERAKALDNHLNHIFELHKSSVDYAIKNGAGDDLTIEKLKKFQSENLKAKENYFWVPLWSKKKVQTEFGSPETFSYTAKAKTKEWRDPEKLFDIDSIALPILSESSFINSIARAQATNEIKAMIADMSGRAGMAVHRKATLTDDEVKIIYGGIDNAKDVKTQEKKFKDEAVKKYTKNVPTEEQYVKRANKEFDKSGIGNTIKDFAKIRGTTGKKITGEGLVRRLSAGNGDGLRIFSDIQDQSYNFLKKMYDYNKKDGNGIKLDFEDYFYCNFTLKMAEAMKSTNPEVEMNRVIADAIHDVNPYFSKAEIAKAHAKDIDSDSVRSFSKWAKTEGNVKFKADSPVNEKSVDRLIADKKEGIKYKYGGDSSEEFSYGTVDYYEGGVKQQVRLYGPLAESTTKYLNNSMNTVTKRNMVGRMMMRIADFKRRMTTTWDWTRVFPNLSRDIVRGYVTSGGNLFYSPKAVIEDMMASEGWTSEQQAKAMKSLNMVEKRIEGVTYNQSFEAGKRNQGKQLVQQIMDENGTPKAKRIIYDVIHDKTGMIAKPGDAAEHFTRNKLAESAFAQSLASTKNSGMSKEARVEQALKDAEFYGREGTSNFTVRGEFINRVAGYVPYLTSKFASVESFKNTLLANPEGVLSKLADFTFVYCYLLMDNLSREEARKNYYNLTEYDRDNNIIIAASDDTIITIPLDDTMATLVRPFRRVLETLQGVDPITFTELAVGILDLSPLDLTGFSEGDSFNLVRGFERAGSEVAPTLVSGVYSLITGRDPYYGSNISVTAEDLEEYGIYGATPGQLTTTGKNSKNLAAVANATGIPQWMLQQTISHFGGNVGQYVLNMIDRLAGATEDEQGGREFQNAIWKSFTGMDSQAAKSAFYDGIKELKQEKKQVISKLEAINKRAKGSTGQALVEYQEEFRKVKDEYAVRVSDFLNTYLQAYERTGGLSESEANTVYYLFRFDDDDGVYEPGSVTESYAKQMRDAASNDALSGASVIDRYYNRNHDMYQDDEGNWVLSRPYGTQNYLNTLYGKGEKHKVAIANIIEGKDSNIKKMHTLASNQREEARKAQNWDLREAIGYEYNKQLVNAIKPYVNQYGAENVLGNSKVLDYLEDLVFVPSDFIKTKKGGYVSLANNASTQRAFARPYLKWLFGVDTGYSDYKDIDLPVNKIQ